jgi:hypothetical protein
LAAFLLPGGRLPASIAANSLFPTTHANGAKMPTNTMPRIPRSSATYAWLRSGWSLGPDGSCRTVVIKREGIELVGGAEGIRTPDADSSLTAEPWRMVSMVSVTETPALKTRVRTSPRAVAESIQLPITVPMANKPDALCRHCDEWIIRANEKTPWVHVGTMTESCGTYAAPPPPEEESPESIQPGRHLARTTSLPVHGDREKGLRTKFWE